MKKISVLQSLRAIFIILICIEHIDFKNGLDIFAAGGEGVAFFICLSGFLTGYIYISRTIDTSLNGTLRFVCRKLKKFYPLHLLALVFMLLFEVYSIITNDGMKVDLIRDAFIKCILNALFLQVYIPVEGWFMNNINGVCWFLSTIVFCYVFSLVGLKSIKYAKEKRKTVLLFIIIWGVHSVVSHIFKNTEYKTFVTYIFPPYRYLEYYLAMILGFNYSDEFIYLKNKTMVSFAEILAIILWVINHISGYFGYSKIIGSYTIPCAFLIVYVFSKERGIVSSFLDKSFFISMGNASFYIYIMHQVVIRYSKKMCYLIGHGRMATLVSVFAVSCFIVVITRYTEKQLNKRDKEKVALHI